MRQSWLSTKNTRKLCDSLGNSAITLTVCNVHVGVYLLAHVCKILIRSCINGIGSNLHNVQSEVTVCMYLHTISFVHYCVLGKFTAAAMLIILGFLDCTVWPLAMTVLIIGNAVCFNIVSAL